MSENLTQRWAIAGQVLPFELANALAEINGWTKDSNEYQSCVRGWDDDLFRLAKSGELTFKSAQGVPLPPCADAFNLGFVDLHDFCEWADRVGSTGIPKDPHALAKALGFDVEPQAAPVATASASDGDEAWKGKARERAYEIIKRDGAKSLYPSQPDIADEIAKEFRRDGVMGVDGKPIAGGYIKRHALNGISSAQGKQLSTAISRGK